jgi:hypothetical protein
MELVKPLDWAEHPSQPKLLRAITPLGVYGVAAITQAQWQFDPIFGSTVVEDATDMEDAKAKAQADYARRILELTNVPEVIEQMKREIAALEQKHG